MVVLAIISEYNPFHNGHLYHLQKSLEITKADATVAVMSGNFTQRGEPALFDKWTRTEAAIKSGINLVIELPVCYSTSSAELFAFGAVSLLERLGIVNYLSFGSEAGNIDELLMISRILANEDKYFKIYLKKFLKDGFSFARARQMALNELNLNGNLIISPNNILGVEYLKWLIRLNSNIIPITIKRIGSEYYQQKLNETLFISSATSIRKVLNDGDLNRVKKHLPFGSFEVIEKAVLCGKKPIFTKDMENILYYELVKNDNIEEIFDVSEGLHRRIKEMVYKSYSLEDLLLKIKTKRYAYSRLSRILFHTIIRYTKKEAGIFNETGPLYARVLGFDSTGRKLLSSINEKCCIPVITNLGKQYRDLNDTARKMLDKDILSTDIYSILSSLGNIMLSKDFIKSPVIIGK
ncbi:MAG: nucleotidyltransferase [Thermoanaerobacteraceae bacterium]|nr:nucleotidyltransferase [Thermoanaerobacteraceae bacterium]